MGRRHGSSDVNLILFTSKDECVICADVFNILITVDAVGNTSRTRRECSTEVGGKLVDVAAAMYSTLTSPSSLILVVFPVKRCRSIVFRKESKCFKEFSVIREANLPFRAKYKLCHMFQFAL